ncbi:TraV family lipoprotein [Neiella marina]|uniref:TraV family lipoprotein n=1 Tax=Neiella holothuriorum TaxID=2870530 RepID=A0ABS7EGD5_9GAMM|nr:TraV family lipoprotein [Neiella holothuriorum]MBW8191368.1 TraV family lipoprotein [Neiella holothuriorum]
MIKHTLVFAALASTVALSGCSITPMGEEEFGCPGMERGVLCKGPREVYELTNDRENLHDMMLTAEEAKAGKESGAESTNSASAPTEISSSSKGPRGKGRKIERGGPTYDPTHDPDWLEANIDALSEQALNEPTPENIAIYQRAVSVALQRAKADSAPPSTEGTRFVPRSTDRQHPASYDKVQAIGYGGGQNAPVSEHQQLSSFAEPPHDIAPEPLAVLKEAEVMRILVAAYHDETNDLHMPGYVYVDLAPRTWIVGEAANTAPSRIVPLEIRTETQQEMRDREYREQGVSGLGVGQIPHHQKQFEPKPTAGQ